MTSEPQQPYADRVYRSGSAIAGGVLLLALAAWLGTDAVLRGEGRVPLWTLAALALVVPVVAALTLRPAVFAGERRVKVRNPFRTIEAPWGSVETVRARYSCELITTGGAFQLWSIPVSLRARSQAHKHNRRLASGEAPRRGPLGFGRVEPDDAREKTAPSDAAVQELRELAERHHGDPEAQGPVTTRWSYEVLAPAAAGAAALLLLWLTA